MCANGIDWEPFASYACLPAQSRGRRYFELEDSYRNAFQRDRDRVVHTTAFRRLMHKTQVFVAHEGDNYRTRLTHSLEVTQITRTLCRALNVFEDLGEVVALAHDLGHPPFGHAGESALDACMEPWGGFDHNAQALTILTELEQRYAGFSGVNLTWEALEGIAKHNGPIAKPHADLQAYTDQHDLALQEHTSLEAQIAAISDDIAYNHHDLDDGLRAEILTITAVQGLPLLDECFAKAMNAFPNATSETLAHEALRRFCNAMIEDVAIETKRRLMQANVQKCADIRQAPLQMVAFSKKMEAQLEEIRRFLHQNLYQHYRVCRMSHQADLVVRQLFEAFMQKPCLLPTEWQSEDSQQQIKQCAYYIAGMTDRFALTEHRRIFGSVFSFVFGAV